MSAAMQDLLFLSLTAVVVLGVVLFYAKRYTKAKKRSQDAMDTIEQMKEKYRVISLEDLENAPDGNYTHVILYHLMSKEDEYFKIDDPDVSFHDYITKPERKIYGLYLLERELTHKGSIERFMTSQEGSMFVKDLEELFTDVKQFELKDCFFEAIEYYRYSVGETDVENEEGAYSSYNLSDFKEELISFIRQEAFLSTINEYVGENASLFIEN